jgi:hypothetical protein
VALFGGVTGVEAGATGGVLDEPDPESEDDLVVEPSVPSASEEATAGSSASVEAPAAPDFACVSVIDQSCSLGSGQRA